MPGRAKTRRQTKEEIMKKSLVAVAAIAMVIAMVGGVWAAGSTNSSVNATGTVANVCQFGGAPAIDFGTGDANAGFGAATITQPTLWCTKGYTAAVTDDGGSNTGHTAGTFKLNDGTGNLITYNLTYTAAPLGNGTGTTNLMTISANIPTANVANAPAGVYTDTVVLTIAY